MQDVLSEYPQCGVLELNAETAFVLLVDMLDILLEGCTESGEEAERLARMMVNDCMARLTELYGERASNEECVCGVYFLVRMLESVLLLSQHCLPRQWVWQMEKHLQQLPQPRGFFAAFERGFSYSEGESLQAWVQQYWQSEDFLSDEVEETLSEVKGMQPRMNVINNYGSLDFYQDSLRNDGCKVVSIHS